MQGSSLGWGVAACLLLVLLATAGCSEAQPEPSQAAQPAVSEVGRRFHAADCGAIDGQVLWQGDLPKVEDLQVLPNPLAGEVMHHKQTRPNPNLPHVDPNTQGVSSAVVFLRHVDPLRSSSSQPRSASSTPSSSCSSSTRPRTRPRPPSKWLTSYFATALARSCRSRGAPTPIMGSLAAALVCACSPGIAFCTCCRRAAPRSSAWPFRTRTSRSIGR